MDSTGPASRFARDRFRWRRLPLWVRLVIIVHFTMLLLTGVPYAGVALARADLRRAIVRMSGADTGSGWFSMRDVTGHFLRIELDDERWPVVWFERELIAIDRTTGDVISWRTVGEVGWRATKRDEPARRFGDGEHRFYDDVREYYEARFQRAAGVE